MGACHYEDAYMQDMDHWGDPWADDADNNPPTKEEVTTPQPPTSNVRDSVALTGFVDDAQWGSVEEDDEFGGWETSPTFRDATYDEPPEAHDPEPTTSHSEVETIQDTSHDRTVKVGDVYNLDSEGWGSLEADHENSLGSDRVVSEASDSATTVQADDIAGRPSIDQSEIRQEDDLSTRPSTSPSDSHTDAPTESPRTSFEDERLNAKTTDIRQEFVVPLDQEMPSVPQNILENESEENRRVDKAGIENLNGNDEVQSNTEPIQATEGQILDNENGDNHTHEHREPSRSFDQPAAAIELDLDRSLLDELFPPPQAHKEMQQAYDDPIYSTSARKTWYRLTRRQTMREFNHGGTDDNYVRATWANSHIRIEIAKIVGRWTSEERASGRGNAAGGMFNWDRAATSDPKTLFAHPKKQASIPLASAAGSANHLQPLSPTVPAAFNWSSTSDGANPWNDDISSPRSVSPPITPKHNAISRVQGHNPRAVSVDLTSRRPEQVSHKRTITASSSDLRDVALGDRPQILSPVSSTPRTTIPASLNSPISQSSEASQTSAPRINGATGDATALDITPSLAPASSVEENEDDDDWGEMVDSPATPTLPKIPEVPVMPLATSNPASIPAPSSMRSSSSPLASASHSASTIVRLKGVVSPTSANFKFNSFVPENAEQGPIGPGLLKPTKLTLSTNENWQADSAVISEAEGSSLQAPTQHISDIDGGDDFSPFASSNTEQVVASPALPLVSPPASATHPTSNANLEDDFSIFESTPQSVVPAPTQTQILSDPSDPWSIFESTSTAAPEPTPFVRPPQRSVTPPPKQPLTSATNSAQKRRDEEDDIIQSIIQGLPNLEYMLRR